MMDFNIEADARFNFSVFEEIQRALKLGSKSPSFGVPFSVQPAWHLLQSLQAQK